MLLKGIEGRTLDVSKSRVSLQVPKRLRSPLQNLPLVLAGDVEFLQLLAFPRGLPVFEAVKNVLKPIVLCSKDLFVVCLFAFLPKHEYLPAT